MEAQLEQGQRRIVLEGRFAPGTEDWVYLPFEVPAGIASLEVAYTYDRPDVPDGLPTNACDIGVFDPDGFRGYSGGARSGFRIGDPDHTTPGYVAGPIPAGTWQVLLAPYTIAPAGLAYRVDVTMSPGAAPRAVTPVYAPATAAGRGPDWYRGDMHLHTEHSDGKRTPAELIAEARAAGLDFIVSTEHNTHTAHAELGRHVDPGGPLLVLGGEEVTTRSGHLVAAGLPPGTWLDWRFRAGDGRLPAVLDQIHAAGGLAIAAHPHAPCLGCQWKFGFDGIDAVEVWNGPWTPDDEVSLQHWNAGLLAGPAPGEPGGWLPAVGNSDSHHREQMVGLAQTVVHADDLSWEALGAGIRAGRCYVTGSSEVALTFTAAAAADSDRTVSIGQRLVAGGATPVTCTVGVRGAGAAYVRFVTDEGWAAMFPITPDTVDETDTATVAWTTSPAVSRYVRVEVRRAGEGAWVPGLEPMLAFTNPIFLGHANQSKRATN